MTVMETLATRLAVPTQNDNVGRLDNPVDAEDAVRELMVTELMAEHSVRGSLNDEQQRACAAYMRGQRHDAYAEFVFFELLPRGR